MNIRDEIKKLEDTRTEKARAINEMKDKILTLESEMFKINTKIEIYSELIDFDIGKKKDLTDDKLIEVATDVINKNPKMQRVNQIVTALIASGFNFEANEIAKRMKKTGKLTINKDGFWEIVSKEDAMFE